jgi:hypothetical protein
LVTPRAAGDGIRQDDLAPGDEIQSLIEGRGRALSSDFGTRPDSGSMSGSSAPTAVSDILRRKWGIHGGCSPLFESASPISLGNSRRDAQN